MLNGELKGPLPTHVPIHPLTRALTRSHARPLTHPLISPSTHAHNHPRAATQLLAQAPTHASTQSPSCISSTHMPAFTWACCLSMKLPYCQTYLTGSCLLTCLPLCGKVFAISQLLALQNTCVHQVPCKESQATFTQIPTGNNHPGACLLANTLQAQTVLMPAYGSRKTHSWQRLPASVPWSKAGQLVL